MVGTLLSDEVWARIESVLPGREGDPGRTATDNRRFVEAVLWIGRTAARGAICRRRSADGIGVRAFLPVASQGCVGNRPRCGRRNRDQACVDRFDHRARAPAFVRSSKKNGPQALGRSRDGLTTKLHLAVDDAGRRLRLIATEGQVSDITCANELVEHLRTGAVIADKGYDSNAFVESIRTTRAKAVIPPRSNLKTKRRYSRVLYRTRNIAERFCSRIKHFRRVVTRYDKLAGNYLAFASLVCAFGPLVRM
ncbi:IS5 family transposase [Paraburkholderia atlantica]|uniref:IS5 family transposase n=1 Tax=Paraburkholderia atlantica TaxID=2654982 RepID=UPI001D12E518|nr:IS5 family transposase [Paraburkholderia atlantica]